MDKKKQFANFMIWMCVTMFYCYQYVLRVLPNIIMPELMSKFNIGAGEFGQFAGIYYIGYIIVHIPVGLLLSRFGGKKILPVFILISSLSLVPLVYGREWEYAIAGRLLTGIGSSAAIIGALQIFRVIYHQHFTRMLGFAVFLGSITAVYGSKPVSYVLSTMGIENAINILIITGIVLSALAFILLPKAAHSAEKSNIAEDIRAILFNRKILIVSVLAGLMIGPLEGFADAWGSSFMTSLYGIEREAANNIVSAILLGMCLGCIILPYIADKIEACYAVTITSGIVMCLAFVYLLKGYAQVETLYITCLSIGIFCAYQVVIIAKVATFVPERLSGMASAVANMVIMAFGSIFHNIIGSTMDRLWDGSMREGVKIYSSSAFIEGIAVIPIALAIAVTGLIIVVIMEKFKKSSANI